MRILSPALQFSFTPCNGFQYQWGRFYHLVDANADLTQRYANVTFVDNEWIFSNPVDVVVPNTPVAPPLRSRRDRYSSLTLARRACLECESILSPNPKAM